VLPSESAGRPPTQGTSAATAPRLSRHAMPPVPRRPYPGARCWQTQPMTTPCCDANVCWPGFSPSRPRRSPGHPVRCRDSVGGHRHRSSNPRRGSHPHGPGSCRASQWYRCRSAARKRPPGLRFGVGYRCYLKLGARYYNPTTARFTQPDSAHTCGGYSYASDNPANATDPTGRDSNWFGELSQAADLLNACFATGAVAGAYGGLVGATIGPEGAVGGGLIGFVYGCNAGIISQDQTGYTVQN
jgi:RHS repeat-associated protein